MKAQLSIVLVVLLLTTAVQANTSQDAQNWYEQALELIEMKQYPQALTSLRQLQRAYPGFKKIAAVQTRIAVLQESQDAGDSLAVFLSALALRDSGQIDAALKELSVIAEADPAGSLTDDALYISAYLHVMDRYDFAAARSDLEKLNQRFPDSAYSDSAQYLDAIALEQMGSTAAARRLLIDLRERHTALSLPLNFRWPNGTALSRYWFDRADRRLAIVEQRMATASTLKTSDREPNGKLRVAVNVNGVEMQLLLVPSPLTKNTEWLGGDLRSALPPAIGIYDGEVEGIADSWVRAVLSDNQISGVLHINGTQQKLYPANLIGTLDYYQPRAKKPDWAGKAQSPLAEKLQGLDALVAPPVSNTGMQNRSRSIATDVRAVPVSVVIDSQYDRYYAGGGLANALNNLNIADGVYRQFGLALVLDEALTLDASADPLALGAVTLETILRTFRDYRLQYKTIFDDSALSYLFTGNPKTDITLGLAWIDTACRVDGYDVGVTTPTTFGDVLITHELGHSLGAQHDTDTICNDNSLSLMWPNISQRTQTQFSYCSKQRILETRVKNCLKNTIDLNLVADSNSTTISFTLSNPDSALTLDAWLTIESSAPDQLQWPAYCQSLTPTSATCFVDSITPSERRTLSFDVDEAFHGSNAPVTAQLVPVGVLELQASDNLATASPAGGATMSHLNVNSQSVDNTNLPSNTATVSPVTGAAKSAGAFGPVENSLSLLLLYLWYRRNMGPCSQGNLVYVLLKLAVLSRGTECLNIRTTHQL